MSPNQAAGACSISRARFVLLLARWARLFIAPPSLATLRQRLRGRGTETDASIRTRLETALKEIEYARMPGVHDLVIVNDDIERAYKIFERVALGDSAPADALPPLDDEL